MCEGEAELILYNLEDYFQIPCCPHSVDAFLSEIEKSIQVIDNNGKLILLSELVTTEMVVRAIKSIPERENRTPQNIGPILGISAASCEKLLDEMVKKGEAIEWKKAVVVIYVIGCKGVIDDKPFCNCRSSC